MCVRFLGQFTNILYICSESHAGISDEIFCLYKNQGYEQGIILYKGRIKEIKR